MKAGEVLEHKDEVSSQDWHDWQAEDQGLNRFLSSTDDRRPDHPPELVPGKRWLYIAPNMKWVDRPTAVGDLDISCFDQDDVVVVLREGVELPTHTLVKFVNEAHAVIVLRVLQNSTEYYLSPQ